MHPWLDRFLQGFSFRINYRALRYIVVCAMALAGALAGAILSGGDVSWVIILGAGFYLTGRILVWAIYRE